VVFAGLVYKFVKERPRKNSICSQSRDSSDEMLMTRSNELKADRRAAGTRAAIGWAVVVIIVVILAIPWLAARRSPHGPREAGFARFMTNVCSAT
jgi:hypothetical protein